MLAAAICTALIEQDGKDDDDGNLEDAVPAERDEEEPDRGDEESEDNIPLDQLENHRRVRMLFEPDQDEDGPDEPVPEEEEAVEKIMN